MLKPEELLQYPLVPRSKNFKFFDVVSSNVVQKKEESVLAKQTII